MNKTLKTLAIAGIASLALCGSAMAAPKGGNMGRAPQGTHQVQKAPDKGQARKSAPRKAEAPRQVENHRGHDVAHIAPEPRHEPAPRCNKHHKHTCDCAGWEYLGEMIVEHLLGC